MFKDKFMRKISIDYDTECWNWIGTKNKEGYGKVRRNTKLILTHRYSWEKLVGPLPAYDTSLGKNTLVINHLCRNTSCVNPEHLEITTVENNVLTGFGSPAENKRKDVCPICSSEFSYYSNGDRYCFPCNQKKYIDKKDYYKERHSDFISKHPNYYRDWEVKNKERRREQRRLRRLLKKSEPT